MKEVGYYNGKLGPLEEIQCPILDRAVYGYRHNEDGITHSAFSNRRYDDIWAIDQCIAFFEDNGEMQTENAFIMVCFLFGVFLLFC